MSQFLHTLCDTRRAASHDISVTNSASDELDSISYLQLLTRFCTGISARNLHTVSERMMSCSDKTLTLKWQAVLAKVTQIVFRRIPNDNAVNSASFRECNLAIQNNRCTCVSFADYMRTILSDPVIQDCFMKNHPQIKKIRKGKKNNKKEKTKPVCLITVMFKHRTFL